MVAPAFGFSAGDFIAAVKLIGQVAKALQETDGATEDFRMLQQELSQLQAVLEHIQSLPLESGGSMTHYNTVRGMALTIQHLLRALLDKMEAYRPALAPGSLAAKWRKAKGQVQWTLGMQNEVVKMRGIVTMEIVSLTTLILLPLGPGVRNVQKLCLEQAVHASAMEKNSKT
ncbi:hypothetical protein BDV96DRAFT_31469 [Lophiotrema nucula]|uniref:Fungal N-terminal domain-containing protein n=1 Tax=Lophiotrema nucula TaxID=690887 RepID=A0A6A5ZAX7_9PLEO|nr:hypothetical protein BDV96DRAFT_31469 [Lophiotrema nucula]